MSKDNCKYCNRSGLSIKSVKPELMCDDCLGEYQDQCDREREEARDEV
jgi:hypothetical protein